MIEKNYNQVNKTRLINTFSNKLFRMHKIKTVD